VTSLQEIEKAIEGLSRDQFFELVRRLRRRHADEWDRQIEEDSKSGRLNEFYERLQKESNTTKENSMERAGRELLPARPAQERRSTTAQKEAGNPSFPISLPDRAPVRHLVRHLVRHSHIGGGGSRSGEGGSLGDGVSPPSRSSALSAFPRTSAWPAGTIGLRFIDPPSKVGRSVLAKPSGRCPSLGCFAFPQPSVFLRP